MNTEYIYILFVLTREPTGTKIQSTKVFKRGDSQGVLMELVRQMRELGPDWYGESIPIDGYSYDLITAELVMGP